MIVYSVLETDAYHCTPRECVHDRRPPNTTFQCSYNLSSPVLGANSNVSRSTMEYLGGKNYIENCSAIPNTYTPSSLSTSPSILSIVLIKRTKL